MSRKANIDRIMRGIFLASGLSAIAILFGILGMLLFNGLKTFEEVSFSSFLFSASWNPSAYGTSTYGILAMLVSTGMVTLGSMMIAVPLGVGTAAFLSEIAPSWLSNILKPLIEMLAAIPSVAIGFLGIVLLGPFLADTFGTTNGLSALNGSILLAIMALPTIITVSEDAIRAVPKSYKEASLALGANQWTTLIRVILPSSYSGIIAATMLGMGRAIGETMTVLMATGNATSMPQNWFDSIRTMTATIAIELGEVPFGTTHYYSLFAIGMILFLITLIVNLIAEKIAASYRKQGQ